MRDGRTFSSASEVRFWNVLRVPKRALEKSFLLGEKTLETAGRGEGSTGRDIRSCDDLNPCPELELGLE